MGLIISRAQPDDANALTQITIAAKRHWNYPEAWIQVWIPDLTISPEYISANETWVAIVDGIRVGYYSLKEEKTLWLDNLWVKPEAMGQGIGTGLFRHALERSRARGASILNIEADPNAQSFYEHVGAQKVGEHQRGEMDGQPRILPLMEIEL